MKTIFTFIQRDELEKEIQIKALAFCYELLFWFSFIITGLSLYGVLPQTPFFQILSASCIYLSAFLISVSGFCEIYYRRKFIPKDSDLTIPSYPLLYLKVIVVIYILFTIYANTLL